MNVPLPGDPGLPPEKRLAGKVAIVTGAGSRAPGVGNGRAMAVTFAREGARVALLDDRPAWTEETRQMIEQAGGESIFVHADVADEASCRRAVESTAEAFGALHILVNNVGVTGPAGTAVEVDPDAFDRAMRINVTSMVLMSKYAIPAMLVAGGGSIINIASIAGGVLGWHPSLLYPTSKSAVVGLTKTMAAHHGRQGIRVNAIAPGLVYTPMVAGGMVPAVREARRKRSLLQTEGTAWDVAMAAVFLASDESRWVTGILMTVDAGLTATLGGLPPEEQP